MKNEKLKIKGKNLIKIIKEKKKFAFIFIGIVIVIIAAVIAWSLLASNKKELENRMQELAKNFYEVKYYPGLTNSKTQKTMTEKEKQDYVAKFKDTGITIDLASLARLQNNKEEVLKEFHNKKTKENCNTEKTKASIYPVEPYGPSNYRLEITLDCGFKN